ncbi:MAG TPA: hypothetical protein VNA25_24295 [Phycisphaerae bacterium]|nr:hypothetical protein [Phycisphaerae bacterium]
MTDLQQTHTGRRRALLRRGLAFAAVLAAGLIFRCDHLTDWDSWDYAAQAMMGHSSDLCLGRWWFIAVMRASYWVGSALFGLTLSDGWLAMQVTCAVAMAAAVVVGMAWTGRLTRSASAEVVFAAMVVMGPTIGIYTFSVMTEGLTLLMLSAALWAWELAVGGAGHRRLWAAAAGAAFGLAVSIREPVVLLGLWPILSCLIDRPARRWTLLATAVGAAALTLGIGVIGAWAWYPWTDAGYLEGISKWAGQMARERGMFPVSVAANLGWLAKFSFAAIPTAALLIVPALAWSAFARRRWVWLALSAAPLAISLLMDHTLAVNARHAIPLIWVLAPIAAGAWDCWSRRLAGRLRWPRLRLPAAAGVLLAANAVVLALGWTIIQEEYFDYVRGVDRAYRALLRLPTDAAVVPGPGTPAAYFLRRLRVKDFDVIASGWAWPEDPDRQFARRLAEGKQVFVYFDEETWRRAARNSGEWRAIRQVMSRYRRGEWVGPLVRIRGLMTSSAAATEPTGPARPPEPRGPAVSGAARPPS